MELIWCPHASFYIGDSYSNLDKNPVIITKGFYLSEYEVTQKDYRKVMGTNPSKFKGEKMPVEKV
jgi:formylglycine-generating enzyme required for sulfatase activity